MLLRRQSHPFGFSGGMADTLSPALLNENEVVSLRNLIPYAKMAVTRPGLEIVNPGGLGTLDPASYKLRSILMHVDPVDGTRTLLAGCYAGFAKLNSASGIFEPIPVLSGLILGSYRPWSRCQTLGASYWCRDDSGGILRADPASVGRAGIVQPSSAPVLADGGAFGNMDAGTYYVVVRFKNSRTGAVSNYSDPSNSQVIVANHKLTVTSIPTSTDWQVDTREIGVTIANRPGTYYLAATISDNLSTSVTFNVTPAQMGSEPFNRRNDAPPGNASFVAWWDAAQALVTTDGKSLFVSETGLPESFSDNIYDFGADDGFPISGILPIGQRVLVGKPNRVDMLSGLERREFRKDMLTDNYGVASGLSMKAVGSTAFWLAQAKDGLCVVRSDGATITTVNDDKIDALLAQVPAAFLPHVEAWVYPYYNLYCLSLSRGQYINESRYVPEVIAAYDYKAQRWTTLDFDPRFLGQPDATSFPPQTLAPISYCDWRDDNDEVVGYLAFDYSRDTSDADVQPRKPWEFVYSLTGVGEDPGGDIPWSALSRVLAPKEIGYQHKPSVLHLTLAAPGNSGATREIAVKQYRDGDGSLYESDAFDVPVSTGPVTRRLPISSRSTPRLSTNYQIEVSGTRDVELHDNSSLDMEESGVRNTTLSQAERTQGDGD